MRLQSADQCGYIQLRSVYLQFEMNIYTESDVYRCIFSENIFIQGVREVAERNVQIHGIKRK